MKRMLLAALSLMLALAAASAQGKLVIYAALDAKTIGDLTAAFKAKTGIDSEIALQIEQAGTVASRVKTEAGNPRADIVIGGNSTVHGDLAAGGFTEPYASPVVKQAGIDKKFMDEKGFWTGWYFGALCLIYNNERFNKELAPKGLKPPASWDDLLDPAYKGEVIASNPATTGAAYLMLAAQIFRLKGEEAGFDYIRKLNANVAQYTAGANGSIPLVSQGEAIAGFAWGHDTIKQKLQGNLPITVVFPKDTGFEIGAVSIVKGAPDGALARKFVDFILSPEAQSINAADGYRYPVRGDVALPAGMPAFKELSLAPWDLKLAAAKTDEWKKRWSSITGK